MGQRQRGSAIRRRIPELLLAAASMLVTLMLLEVGTRIAYPVSIDVLRLGSFTRRSTLPGQYTELIPNSSNPHFVGGPVRIDSRGFRGPEFRLEKSPGCFRILAVGDSITFGYGVREEESYHAVLARLLTDERRAGLAFEAINAGLTSADLAYDYHFLRRECGALKPDLVLIGLALNDIHRYPPDVTDPSAERPAPTPLSRKRRASRFLHQRSYLYAAIYRQLKSLLYGLGVLDINELQGYNFETLKPSSPELEEAWDDSLKLLDAALHEAEECGAGVAAVVFPLEVQLSPEALRFYDERMKLDVASLTSSGAPQEKLLEFGRRSGSHVIDLLPALRRFDHREMFLRNRAVSFDPVHPSAKGHRVAAEKLLHELTSLGLLPAGDTKDLG